MSPIESHLRKIHWICLFFSPVFLPWVVRHAWRSWAGPGSTALSRALLMIFVLAAVWAGVDAVRWVIGMTYPRGLFYD